jgi:hypothetical protein
MGLAFRVLFPTKNKRRKEIHTKENSNKIKPAHQGEYGWW